MKNFTDLIKERLPKNYFNLDVSVPVPGKTMVKNNAGGFVFEVDRWKQLERFLILGSDKNGYYVSAKESTLKSYDILKECLNINAKKTLDIIIDISVNSRAPKNDGAIFALAVCCAYENSRKDFQNDVRQMAYLAIPLVCRIGTHILQFVEAVTSLRGMGNGLKKAIAAWYLEKEPRAFAFQVTKYANRAGWTHGDVFRIIHPKTNKDQYNTLIRYCTKRYSEICKPSTVNRPNGKVSEYYSIADYPEYLDVVEEAKKCTDSKELCKLIEEYNLPREVIPTSMLNDIEVWSTLLNAGEGMPLGALIRNLNKMTSIGLLKDNNAAVKKVVALFGDQDKLRASKLHPISILISAKQYAAGKGDKGSLTWSPVSTINAALDDAFKASFKYIKPTNKNYMVGIDVSRSMGCQVSSNLTACEAAGAMSLAITCSEPWVESYAFNLGITKLPFNKKSTLQSVIPHIDAINGGGTNASLLVQKAIDDKLEVDCFVTITDNETWDGKHTFKLLEKYRNKVDKPVKSVNMATAVSAFTISDPSDFNSLDIAGFDSNVPAIISEFVNL